MTSIIGHLPLHPYAISRPPRQWGNAAVGTAALSQQQQQLDRLRLCLTQWARSFGKTDIYLAAVLSYETMQGIVGYCFYMTLWGNTTAGFWLLLKIRWLDRMTFWLTWNLKEQKFNIYLQQYTSGLRGSYKCLACVNEQILEGHVMGSWQQKIMILLIPIWVCWNDCNCHRAPVLPLSINIL